MNAALLRSVSPASCGFDRHGLRGLIVPSFVTRSAARYRISSKGEVVASQRGFWIAANSRSPWLPASRRASRGVVAVRHWELIVTTNWRDVDIGELRALLTGTKQNCDQFPKLNPDGSIAEVSPVKLKRAIQHSFIVVAMYIRGELHEDYFPDRPKNEETPPPSRSKRTLVAFARATSDRALTASIHDVAVAPSLQGRGIGRHLMHRMVRELGRYGIADIAVMADPKTKPFFRRCGFGSDVLGSTAMMYTAESDAMLLVPPAVQASRRKEIANSVASA